MELVVGMGLMIVSNQVSNSHFALENLMIYNALPSSQISKLADWSGSIQKHYSTMSFIKRRLGLTGVEGIIPHLGLKTIGNSLIRA